MLYGNGRSKALDIRWEVFLDPRASGMREGKEQEDRAVIFTTKIRAWGRARGYERIEMRRHQSLLREKMPSKVWESAKEGFCPYRPYPLTFEGEHRGLVSGSVAGAPKTRSL
jgi:hypothetical protein